MPLEKSSGGRLSFCPALAQMSRRILDMRSRSFCLAAVVALIASMIILKSWSASFVASIKTVKHISAMSPPGGNTPIFLMGKFVSRALFGVLPFDLIRNLLFDFNKAPSYSSFRPSAATQ
jgi:hypothetical protein